MTRLFYDCEFIEDGRTIDLISIGIVAEDGREYYAVNSGFNMDKLARNQWLIENVWPSLPQVRGDARMQILATARPDWAVSRKRQMERLFDRTADEVKNRRTIAGEVVEFIHYTPNAQLWAWYGAYDHVALAQLWGPMAKLPSRVPMWTNDLKQEATRLGLSDDDLPQQEHGQHNALQDARHNLVIARFLDEHAAAR